MENKTVDWNKITVEAVKKDKNFFIDMKKGDSKVIILNNAVVVLTKKKTIGKGESIMTITSYDNLLRLDAVLIFEE